MQYSNLLLDTSGHIATLKLNRPSRLNALSAALLQEIISAASEIAASDARAVVVSGEGRAFCAGVDLELFQSAIEGSRSERADAFRLGGEMADALEAIPQPTVAALHGFVVGGGLVVAAATDLRVAADDTVFSIPEVELGIPLAWGGIDRLVREIGPTLTKELVMTCRTFTADEAKSAGLLNATVPAHQVLQAAHELAETVSGKPSEAIRITKAHVNEVTSGDTSRDDASCAADAVVSDESTAARQSYLASMRKSQ